MIPTMVKITMRSMIQRREKWLIARVKGLSGERSWASSATRAR